MISQKISSSDIRVNNTSKVANYCINNQNFTQPSESFKPSLEGIWHQPNNKTKNEIISQKNFPVTCLIDMENPNLEKLFTKEKLIFCYRVVLGAIKSCLTKNYSDFDGHTTSNCCHGMALLAQNLINSTIQLDLALLQRKGEQILQVLEGEENADEQLTCRWLVPKSLIYLSGLYILNFAKEINPSKGARTATKKLKAFALISTNFCNEITHYLQKHFSNLIAMRYESYLNEIEQGMQICGASIELWGKYIRLDFIRTDKRGVKYASNLFSMQVSLAYLSYSRAKVALINDIIDESGQIKGRYVCIFEGDGAGNLKALTSEEIKVLSFFHENEPIVVLGGCIHSNALTKDSVSFKMHPWLDQLSNLVLACDVFYPQFFQVTDDPGFDYSPIIPREENLKRIIKNHLDIKGVCATDASLYCLTHVYPASIGQVLKVLNSEDENALPKSYIPNDKSAKNPLQAEYSA